MVSDRIHAAAISSAVSRGAALLVEGDGGIAEGAPEASVLRMPMSDRAIGGVAVGMAIGGRGVIVEVADVSRVEALAEVWSEAARMAAFGPVPAVWWLPVGGVEGEVAVLDRLTSIEGLDVVVPADIGTVEGHVARALAEGRPTVLLVDRSLGEAAPEVVVERPRLTLVVVGRAAVAVPEGVEVVRLERLHERGGLGERVAASGRLVVSVPGGEAAFGRRVLQECLDGAFLYLESPPVVVARGDEADLTSALVASMAY